MIMQLLKERRLEQWAQVFTVTSLEFQDGRRLLILQLTTRGGAHESAIPSVGYLKVAAI